MPTINVHGRQGVVVGLAVAVGLGLMAGTGAFSLSFLRIPGLSPAAAPAPAPAAAPSSGSTSTTPAGVQTMTGAPPAPLSQAF